MRQRVPTPPSMRWQFLTAFPCLILGSAEDCRTCFICIFFLFQHRSINHNMSDTNDDDMMLSEEEDYGFDYEDASDSEGEDDELVILENRYYSAKGMLQEGDTKQQHEALRLFTQVVEMEQEKGDWCASSFLPATLSYAQGTVPLFLGQQGL
jgi:hypothetical protein